MRKTIIFFSFVCINLCFGKTWTQITGGCNCYGETNDSLLVNSTLDGGILLFGDTSLTLFSAHPIMYNDEALPTSKYVLNFSGLCSNADIKSDDACLKLRMGIYRYEKSEDLEEAILFQKQKMNNFNTLGLLGDSLNISDTNYFSPLRLTDTIAPNPDSMFVGESFDNYSLSEGSLLDTIQFVLKKDSSYYAYCLYVQSKYCWSFLFQCEFQDDGTTEFEPFETIEYPYPYYNPTGSKCLTKSEYEDYLSPIFTPAHRKEQTAKMNSVPYQVNGSRSRGGASSVIIRDGQPKLELRK